jgi:two-component system OmpR family sensor kinase
VLRRVGDRAVLEVRDTGPGFSDEDAAHVFERFYRTDRSRTRASGGVGLGLSIVAAIVHAHGGTAQAGGGAGAGASIVLSLPLLDVQA